MTRKVYELLENSYKHFQTNYIMSISNEEKKENINSG